MRTQNQRIVVGLLCLMAIFGLVWADITPYRTNVLHVVKARSWHDQAALGPQLHNDVNMSTDAMFSELASQSQESSLSASSVHDSAPAVKLSRFLSAYQQQTMNKNVLDTVPQASSLRKWLVTFHAPLSQADRATVNEHIAPYKLGRYFPHLSHEVWGPSDATAFHTIFAAVPGFVKARPLEPHHKMDAHLLSDLVSLSNSLFKMKSRAQSAQTPAIDSLLQHRLTAKGLSGSSEITDHVAFHEAKREALEAAIAFSQVTSLSDLIPVRVLVDPTAVASFVADPSHSADDQLVPSPTYSAQQQHNNTNQSDHDTPRRIVESWVAAYSTPQQGVRATASGETTAASVLPMGGHPCEDAIFTPSYALLGHDTFHAHIPLERVPACIAWLTARHEVQRVEKLTEFAPQNERANYLLQDRSYAHLAFAAHGLDGDGEIVMVADTGLDHDHCFFEDTDQKVKHETYTKDLVIVPNYNHRKVIYYLIDGGDRYDTDGHGTHVVGSIAGQATETEALHYNRYQGTAPKAKIFFVDVGRDRRLYVNDYIADIMKKSHDAGAFISSQSWGGSDGYNSFSISIDEFLFNNPEHLALVAAGNSGYASTLTHSSYTILNPGSCKNVLTVGAANNLSPLTYFRITYSNPAPNAPTQVPILPATFGGAFTTNMLQDVELVFYPTKLESACTQISDPASISGKAVVIRRGTCRFATIAEALHNKGAKMLIVVNTVPNTLVRISDDASSKPVLFIPVGMVQKELGETILEQLSQHNTVTLSGGLYADEANLPVELSSRTMTDFSSRGPTYDGRIKPEITSPGALIVSANSDGNPNTRNCLPKGNYSPLSIKSGTSMATPLAAGMLTLARQYFTKGFYPSGRANPADALQPTSALLKAVATTSARLLSGAIATRSPLRSFERDVSEPPSYTQGYGRLQLDRVLEFEPTESTGDHRVNFWLDQSALEETNATKSYCFAIDTTPGTPTALDDSIGFKVTLAWTDPPPPLSASKVLVNDLDLIVETQQKVLHYNSNNSVVFNQKGYVYAGNNPESTASDFGDQIAFDSLNNIEQVRIPYSRFPTIGQVEVSKEAHLSPETASVTYVSVHVLARHVDATYSPQAFALVAAGGPTTKVRNVDMSECLNPERGSLSATVPCPRHCSEHGQCNDDGTCTCSPVNVNDIAMPTTGAACEIVPRPLTFCIDTHECDNDDPTPYRVRSKFTSQPNVWSYFRIDVKKYQGTSTLVLTRVSGFGDADIYVKIDGLPTRSDYDASNEECNSCSPATSSSISITPEMLAKAQGAIYVGVYGVCCEPGVYTLSFASEPPTLTPEVWLTAWPIVMGIIAFLALCGYLYTKWWKRRSGASPTTGTSYASPPSPSVPPAPANNPPARGLRLGSGYPAAEARAVEMYGLPNRIPERQPGPFTQPASHEAYAGAQIVQDEEPSLPSQPVSARAPVSPQVPSQAMTANVSKPPGATKNGYEMLDDDGDVEQSQMSVGVVTSHQSNSTAAPVLSERSQSTNIATPRVAQTSAAELSATAAGASSAATRDIAAIRAARLADRALQRR